MATRWVLDDFSPTRAHRAPLPRRRAARHDPAAAPPRDARSDRGRDIPVYRPVPLSVLRHRSTTPRGLAAVVVQPQGLFTILFSALAVREWPTRRQWTGCALGAAGLLLVATTVGGDLTALGLLLSAISAMSWGVGNVLVKRLPPVDVLG